MERYSSWADSVSDDTMTTSSSSLEDQAEGGWRGAEEGQGPPMEQAEEGWRGPEEARGLQVQHHISPSKFLSVEASSVLSTLQTIPEFAESMELIDSVSVCRCAFGVCVCGSVCLHIPDPEYGCILNPL